MILGTGIDLVDSIRIERLMSEHEVRFMQKHFTVIEIEHVMSLKEEKARALSLAKRFAAKEACAKALGTGFRDGIHMCDIGVENDALGKPILSLTNGALKRLEEMTAEGMSAHLHLSLTDEPPYAQAQVIIETL